MRTTKPNPFDPRLGAIPRSVIAGGWADSRDPGATVGRRLLLGFPGSGRTVALDTAEQAARRANWAVIAEDATSGLAQRVRDTHLPSLAEALGISMQYRRRTGAFAPQFGVGGGGGRAASISNIGDYVARIAETLAGHGSGILFTVDDATTAIIDELREIISAGLGHGNVKIVVTMLPTEYGKLGRGNDVFAEFFIERFTRLPASFVRDALINAAETAGITWDEEALTQAVAATHGYPLLVQLVAHYCWNSLALNTTEIGEAITAAHREFGARVLQPLMGELSGLDIAFLQAVAAGETPVKIADIVARVGRSADTVAQYRRRLVDRGYIVMVRRGWVDFALPTMGEYLRGLG